MGIDISNKVSDEDRQAVLNDASSNTLSDEEIDDFFDSTDDLFGDFNFGGDAGTESNINSTNSDSGVQWGNVNNSSNQNNGVSTQNKTKTDELFDKALEGTAEVSKNIFGILKQLKSSLKYRTIDDYGYLATLELKTGALLSIIGFGLLLILLICRVNKFIMTTVNIGVCGIIMASIGIAALYISAYLAARGIDIGEPYAEADDLSSQSADSIDSFDNAWDDIFDDDEQEEDYNLDEESDEDDSWLDDALEESNESEKRNMISMFDCEQDELDSDSILNNISENAVLTRKYLVDTFKSILPLSSPTFHDKREIAQDTNDFINIEAICLKAISNILNCDISEIASRADRMYETDFCYEIYIQRVKRLKNIKALEKEIEAYFRSDSTDYAVKATVDIEGDFYKIVVSKGETKTVTIGDVLGRPEYYEMFIDEHMRIPMIYGMTELGDISIGDGKACDSTLIAGKQRSGKSWYLLSMLMCLMLFNAPELVQMILIDPKDTALFKVISWMPHVAGLHTSKNILNVLDDIINNEGAYRKKLLKDNMCDTIWELWDKGVKLPLIYVCIDEYITAQNDLGDRAKELNEKLLVIKTQFPSQGIRVIFVPHRATGVVDKTNRATTSLKVAVGTDLDDTIDTIGEKWDRPLINPGDMALRAPSMMKAQFMRGVALARSDEENRKVIELAAKAYYKMGVDIPDMSRMPIACNRNSDAIRAELSGTSIREQYNANSIYSILEED